jgi:hypothetical protein
LGHPGVGKTTELSRLLFGLEDRFFALRLSVTSELNPGTLRFYDVLLPILIRLVQEVSEPSVIGFEDTEIKAMLSRVRDHLATKWTKHLRVDTGEFGAGLQLPFLKLFGNIKQGRTLERGTEDYELSLLREAFPWDTAPRYLLRDRDKIFGQAFVEQVKSMGIKQVLSAPRSPWQRAYVERVIGTIRRECLDHVIVFDETSLQRHISAFVDYYHRTRTHLGLEKDTPEFRPVEPPDRGRIVSIPQVGGLHHRYERRAA